MSHEMLPQPRQHLAEPQTPGHRMADPDCLCRDLWPLGHRDHRVSGRSRRLWRSSLTALAIAQYSSLQHEVLHGHPFRNQTLTEALVFPGLTLFVPYLRFKDLHLQHHFDPTLTDPYDDPESNYQDPAVWARLSGPTQGGAAVQQHAVRADADRARRCRLWALVTGDMAAIRRGDRRVALGWALHAGRGGAGGSGWLLAVGTMPVWAYLLAAYLGWSLLKIRTFLEHRAHEAARARTVVIEDRGPLSLAVSEQQLPRRAPHAPRRAVVPAAGAVFRATASITCGATTAIVYRSYAEIFRAVPVPRQGPGAASDLPGRQGRRCAGQTIRRNCGVVPELSKNGTPG